MKDFWQKLPKPFYCLAPMADVTDCAFREIIAKRGKPHVFWTEFVSADGLSHPLARKKLLKDLEYGKKEHPIVAQIFGSDPENIEKAAKLCAKLGFDGIDINMGCPDRSIEKQGAGACMMKSPETAALVIKAAKKAGLPVSVKTRIGYGKIDLSWIEFLLEQDLSALTVHLRTRKEMSKVPAHWDLMPEIMRIAKGKTFIIGNGDVTDLADAKKKAEMSGCDGIMFGRAIFGNPWLFAGKVPTTKEKLKTLVEHTKLFEKKLGKHKNFAIMKKHYKAYVNGFPGAKELRMKLMQAEDTKEVEKIIKAEYNSIHDSAI